MVVEPLQKYAPARHGVHRRSVLFVQGADSK
jgi:hypothetical protein